MHFGSAKPKLARQRKEKHVGIRQVRFTRPGRQRIVEISCEIVQGLGPALSLIANKAEQHAERMRLRFTAVEIEFHERQEGRRVRKPGPLDQKTRHFNFGMRTGLQTPIDFQYAVIVEDDRAVRLFRPDAASYQPLWQRDLIEYRGCAAPDLACPFEPHCRALPDRFHQCQRKTVLRQGIDQRSLSPELPQFSECYRDQSLTRFGIGGRPDGGQWQEITLPLAPCQLRLHHPGHERFGRLPVFGWSGNFATRQHRSGLDSLVLGPEPALPRQESRDCITFELRQIVLTEQIGPAMRHHQREKFWWRCSQITSLGGGRQELEPVKAVALQCKEIRQFANWRKGAAPE